MQTDLVDKGSKTPDLCTKANTKSSFVSNTAESCLASVDLSGSNLFESLSPLATESGALAPAPDASADGKSMATDDVV